jgi:hypothetical protein
MLDLLALVQNGSDGILSSRYIKKTSLFGLVFCNDYNRNFETLYAANSIAAGSCESA